VDVNDKTNNNTTGVGESLRQGNIQLQHRKLPASHMPSRTIRMVVNVHTLQRGWVPNRATWRSVNGTHLFNEQSFIHAGDCLPAAATQNDIS
jgi:hypothetical protein